MNERKSIYSLPILIGLLLLSACSSQQDVVPATHTVQPEEPDIEEPVMEEPTITATPRVEYLQPVEPSEVEQTLEDVDASLRVYEKRAIVGDNILNNLYGRPFTAYEMLYQPDINILAVSVAADENFFYFTITLDELNPDVNALTGTYGIEFDRTKTG